MENNGRARHFDIFVISAAVSCVLYLLFFLFSPFIWSLNAKAPEGTFAPYLFNFWFVEHDGIETYVLYAMVFLNIALSFALKKFFDSSVKNNLYRFLMAACSALALFYLIKTGINPPDNDIRNFSIFHFVIVIAGLDLIAAFLIINKINSRILDFLLPFLLVPVCLIATGSYIVFDYNYIYMPALRMLRGFHLSEIYFQYDLLLSLLAAGWMKLGFDIDFFPVFLRSTMYALFIAFYFFFKKLFKDKNLAVLLLFSLVIVRYYSGLDDIAAMPQHTPLRFDLWFFLVLSVYFLGPASVLNGVFLGLMLVFSKAFGVIYTLSYLEFIFILFVAALAERLKKEKFTLKNTAAQTLVFIKPYIASFILIVAGYMANFFIFQDWGLRAASEYQKYGIGFLPIKPASFYWIIMLFFAPFLYILLSLKGKLQERYINTGVLLMLFAVGNSLYFFGRSHELNIVNISTVLLPCLFMFFDALFIRVDGLYAADPSKKRAITWFKTAALFLTMTVILMSYSDKVVSRVIMQVENFRRHNYFPRQTARADLNLIRKMTNNSKKLYFMSYKFDFLYYYYDNYTPLGFYSPFTTWLLKKPMRDFMQGLLDGGYYLVCDYPKLMWQDIDGLDFNKRVDTPMYVFIWKERRP